MTLTAVATDDGVPKLYALPPRPTLVTTVAARGLRVAWFVYRGAGAVTFEPEQFKVWEDRRVGANPPWGPGWEPPPLPPDGKWVTKVTFGRAWNLRRPVSGPRRGSHGRRGCDLRRQPLTAPGPGRKAKRRAPRHDGLQWAREPRKGPMHLN